MRLVSARIAGIGRLLDSKINVDSKVIAVVGPNEAGKTTLLKALMFTDSDEPLAATSRSRAGAITDDSIIVTANFILDDDDRKSVGDLDLAQPPTHIDVSRRAESGRVMVGVQPYPRKSVDSLNKAIVQVRRFARSRELTRISREHESLNLSASTEDEGEDQQPTLKDKVQAVRDQLTAAASSDKPTGGESLLQDLEEISDIMMSIAPKIDVLGAIRACKEWFERDDPSSHVTNRLWRRTPDFLLFGDEDRSLSSTYVLSANLVADTPAALSNLAQLAGLDLQALWNAITTGDLGRRSTLLLSANQKLEHRFTDAWRQSSLTVYLDIDGTTLNIMIKENNETITVFDERSAGLRMFAALLAFIATRNTTVPPILLIDEAENHLHFDAQADLVNTFMIQEQAAKVIYTTHSPACLPPDLGTGIRAVLPSADNGQVSEIHNSFWNRSAGYSPLMLAMGAGAAAFSPARIVVLAEGASEMILLPSLIRAATQLDTLGYQIAPGLSEVPMRLYPELDLEAARVAYLVDGDGAGQSLKSRLIAGGVPAKLIVELGAQTLENLLDSDAYRDTVRALMQETADGKAIPELPKLANEVGSWSTVLKVWAKQHQVKLPSKVAVANRIVETGMIRLNRAERTTLVKLHKRLTTVLRLN